MLNVYFRYVWTHYKSFLTWFILIFALNNQLEWSYNRCFPATNEASKRYKRYENGWNAKISAKRYTLYICGPKFVLVNQLPSDSHTLEWMGLL